MFCIYSLISVIMLFLNFIDYLCVFDMLCVSLCMYKYMHICVHTELITETSTKMENFDKKKNLLATFKIVKSI